MKHCPTCTCQPYTDAEMIGTVEALCRIEGITLEEVRAKWSVQSIYTRRHRIIAAFRRLHPELKLEHLGLMFGRNHSSIVHSCQAAPVQAVEALIEKFREVDGREKAVAADGAGRVLVGGK